jgi:hypothetical protein
MNRKARRAEEVSGAKTRQQFFAAVEHHEYKNGLPITGLAVALRKH